MFDLGAQIEPEASVGVALVRSLADLRKFAIDSYCGQTYCGYFCSALVWILFTGHVPIQFNG